RLLGLTAHRRLRSARGKLSVPALLATAQLARRPSARSIMLTVTVAVSLLSFAATAWDLAGHERQRRAQDEVGAARVYTVDAAGPQAVRNAVDRLDPSGRQLMPAMQSDVVYADSTVPVLAVDPHRLPSVAAWSGLTTGQVRDLARRLPARTAPVVRVHGPLQLTVHPSQVPDGRPMEVIAVLARPDQAPTEVELGELRAGRSTYRAALPQCASGCQLTGLGLARYPGDFHQIAATVEITQVRDGDRTLDLGLTRPDRWRVNHISASSDVRLSTTDDGLKVGYHSSEPADLVVDYASAPRGLPVVLAGGAPADNPHSSQFTFPAFGDTPLPFDVAGRADVIPRAGRHALLVDLDSAQRVLAARLDASDQASFLYQVWAAPGAPAGLADRLNAAGLTVQRTDSLSETRTALSRQAPGLALRLYLVAGVAALLLAVGAVLLGGYVGVRERLYDLAALHAAGIGGADLARAVRREYRILLGVPLLTGLLVGAASSVLLLPSLHLVTSNDSGAHRVYQLGPYWVPGAVLATVLALAVAAGLMTRMLRRVGPERLRNGAR
ncbi:MAG: hypothetical protein WCA46_00765, partial [Actinocatenispora sp.]